MKHRTLIAAIAAGAALPLLVTGCLPQTLVWENAELKTELAHMQAKCPPKEFGSADELLAWVESNDVSEEGTTEYYEEWLRSALQVQKDALEDGYIVNVDYDILDDDSVLVWCTAVVGDRMYFWDPETDEIYEETTFTLLK